MIRTRNKLMSVSGRWIGLFALTALAMLAATAPSRADLIGDYSGNTHPQLSPQPGVDSIINFAVFDRTGGTTGDSFGIGLAGIDTVLSNAGFVIGNAAASPYLWLFQIANAPTSGTTDVSILFGAPGSVVTSTGILPSQYSLNDSGGAVTFSNPFGTAAAAGNPSGDSTNPTGGPAWIVSGQNNTKQPTSLDLFPSALDAIFSNPGLQPGEVSSIYGFSSTEGPSSFSLAHVAGATGASGTSADGYTPSAVPEPASFVLVSMGLIACGVPFLRRRKQTVAN